MTFSPRGTGSCASSCRQRNAIAPGVDAMARRHETAKEIGVRALAQIGLSDVIAVLGAGIRHDADALEHAGVIEQRGYHHRKARLGRASPARYLARQVLGARDVFVFVIVFEIDLAHTACLRTA